jgi:hypothetical protein
MAGPLTEHPVIRFQSAPQDLLRFFIRNADRHEVLEMVQAPFLRPRVLVHGLPGDPCDIRELIEFWKLGVRHRWVALRSCIPRRFAVEANDDTVVWVDDEGVGGASDAVPFLVYAVPLIVDVARIRPVFLMSNTDQMVEAAFEFHRVLHIDQSLPQFMLAQPWKTHVTNTKSIESPANAPSRIQVVEGFGNFVAGVREPAPLLKVISRVVCTLCAVSDGHV